MKMKFSPVIDKNFKPMYYAIKEFEAKADKPFKIAVQRNDGLVHRYDTFITSDANESYKIIERIVKSILWVVGGYKVYASGDSTLIARLKESYKAGGERAFDSDFMSRVYEQPFEIIEVSMDKIPAAKECSLSVGGNLKGCRIGFDAGGSDRKVSAVVDGNAIYSEEVVWHPKTNTDPSYHYQGILDSFKRAASKMPRVDAIGISSAGIYINNRIMVASLFLKVPRERFDADVKDMYIKAAAEIGNVPVEVANDGDVTALAGAMELKDNKVLGIAMGTSEAAGYINSNGGLNGWLSELAFVPCDFSDNAMCDEWSGDIGCGVKYFSQDGVIKLAQMAGFNLDESLPPAENLKKVQNLVASGDKKALEIFEDIGKYLGYSIAYYSLFYDIKHMLLLGRVTSGLGGEKILEWSRKIVKEEFPHLNINISMPDENNRRVGQSVAAASLPAAK